MLIHVVAFRMSAPDVESRERDAREFAERLRSLEGKIPGLIGIEVGLDLGRIDGHADMALTSRHDTYADLEAYQAHPLHVEVAQFGGAIVSERVSVDYEVEDGSGTVQS